MREYCYFDGVFSFEGSISVEIGDTWCRPWRLLYDRVDLYPNVSIKAVKTSGVRLTFTTDAKNIGLKLHEVFDKMKMDVYSNGNLAEQYICGQDKEIFFKPLDSGMKNIEIWLDPRFPFSLEKVLVDDTAAIQRTYIGKQRWVHYGSSISHSSEAGSPSTIWTSIVARKFNLHLTNLGYGAECRTDPMIATMISNLPADFISLKMGINCYSTMAPRYFEGNVIGFINIIREKKADTPLVIISPIFSPDRESQRRYDITMTLEEMRQMLFDIVNKFKKYGDRNIYYVDGLKILGYEHAGYLPDNLHPDAGGQFVMAENFIKEVIPFFVK